MAKINVSEMQRERKERPRQHDAVRATYDVFEIDGRRFIQIDTYGSNNREYQDVISQSIQLDENSVHELMKLLKSHFGQNYIK